MAATLTTEAMVTAIYLRQATLADLTALELLEQTFPGDRLSRRSLRYLVTKGNAAVFVAEQDATLLGDAVVLFRKNSRLARLYSLVVAPEARRQGVGGKLLRAVEAEARARGCTALRLEVREDNSAALTLYQNAGFEAVRRFETYYDDGSAALQMSKQLG